MPQLTTNQERNMKTVDPKDYRSLSMWAIDLVRNNPSMTAEGFDDECQRWGVVCGRGPFYKGVKAYREEHGLGALPRGGKLTGKAPKPANYQSEGQDVLGGTTRGPERRLVRGGAVAVEQSSNELVSRKDRLILSEINEHAARMIAWMRKYNVRVITMESESQEVTLSNEPSVSRQIVPSPHFTVQKK